jgi:hypothetical protein
MKSVKAPNIEIEREDCEEYIVTLFLYVISGSDLSHSAYGGRKSRSHFKASQKEGATAPQQRVRHLGEV